MKTLYTIRIENFILDLLYIMGFIPDNSNDTNKSTSSTNASGSSSSLRTLSDCQIISPTSGQGLIYTGNRWQNQTVGGTLANLTDCSVSGVSNDQLLVFTTASSLNKWTPYSLTGATINDTNKTITLATTLSTLTDCTITTPSDSSTLLYSSYLNKWINTPNQVITMDFSGYIGQSSYAGGAGTSLSPSFYSFNTLLGSIVCDLSFTTQVSSYFIKLPTTLTNGTSIYIQTANTGFSGGLGIMGGATTQENIYYGANTWEGYLYPLTVNTYKMTYWSPSSNNPWYGNTNYTTNSWQVQTVTYIPLSSSITLHNINTNSGISGTYGMPTNPYNGMMMNVKDFGGYSNTSSIVLVQTNSNLLDGSSSNYTINTAYDSLKVVYCGGGSSGNWLTLSSPMSTNINNLSNGQTLTYNSSTKKWVNSTPSSGSSTLSALTDISFSTLSNNQVLQYNISSSKWINATLSKNDSISTLTDCTISNASNGQVLTYNTSSSKWINQAIPNMALNSLSDVSVASRATGNLLLYDGTNWVNSDTIPDNLLFVKDDVDGTKKLQFQLSGITTGTTRVLTVPDYNGTIAVATNTQTNNYALVSNGTSPSWQALTLSKITDFNISTPTNGQLLQYNTLSSKWINYTLNTQVNDSETATLNNMYTTYGGGLGGAGIAQNSYFSVPSYADQGNSIMLTSLTQQISNVVISDYTTNTMNGWSSNNGAQVTYTFNSSQYRFNFLFNTAYSIVKVVYSITLSSVSSVTLYVYGSNNLASYQDTTMPTRTTDTNLVFLGSGTFTGTQGTTITNQTINTIDSTSQFLYLHLFYTASNNFNTVTHPYTGSAITTTNLVNTTDYSIDTNPATGYPRIQNIKVTNIQGYYNTLAILVYELFRRIFPVVRDKNTIVLTDSGSNTVTLTSTSGYPISKSSDVSISNPVSGNLLIYNGTSWTNSDTIPDNLFFIKDDGDGTKKMQFQLSSITAGQTRTFTFPDASCTLVCMNTTQTLTNKTLDDATNTVTCDKLRTTTGTVTINSASAPSAGAVLTATGATGATWLSPSAGIKLLTMSGIQFLNYSFFSGSPPIYTMQIGYDAYVLDSTNAIATTYMYLPTLSGNGTQSFYLQVVGNGASNMALRYGTLQPIYTYADNFSVYGTIQDGKTYLLTYYASSGNSWAITSPTYPNYNIVELANNYIPLKNDIDVYLFGTNNYHAITAYCYVPSSLSNGQLVRVKDANGYMATTKVQLQSYNSNLIEAQTSLLLDTNSKSLLLLYNGSGSSGMLYIL